MPKIEPIAEAPCRITRGESALGSTQLRWHGVVFASFRGAESAELRIDKEGKTATMSIGTRELELVGDVDPKLSRVSPREDALFGGFVHIEEAGWARVADGQPASAMLSVKLPRIIEPVRPLDVVLPCEKLALGARPRRAGARDRARRIMFADGVDAPLRTAPGGEIVAKIHIPKAAKPPPPSKSPPKKGQKAGSPSPSILAAIGALSSETMFLSVFELAREKNEAHIQIVEETTTVEGWVPVSAIQERPDLGGGGGFGVGRGHGRAKTVRCARPVPIYLSQGADVVLAGHYKANATIVLAPPTEGDRLDRRAVLLPREVGWGLGFGRGGALPENVDKGAGAVLSFVTPDTIDGCAEPAPEQPAGPAPTK